jgi:hypothetical protein
LEFRQGQGIRSRWFFNPFLQNFPIAKEKSRRDINSTFLALIPKESNPSSFSNFIQFLFAILAYKILTKIIANRLKLVIGRIISNNHGGFIQKR